MPIHLDMLSNFQGDVLLGGYLLLLIIHNLHQSQSLQIIERMVFTQMIMEKTFILAHLLPYQAVMNLPLFS